MAAYAWHNLCRPRIHAMDRPGGYRTMALIAQLIDVRYIQQPGILRPMRRMAANATFRLHSRMFKDKWSASFRVALGADRVLVSSRFEVVIVEGAMGVVAVAALHQTLFNFVVERRRERSFDIGMAGEAKLRLRYLE